MLRIKTIILAAVVVAVPMFAVPSDAEAGPLLDWIRARRCARAAKNCCQTPTQTAACTPDACGLQPGQCMKTCEQTCSRTVVNYVPYTAYRTCWKRVPVTQYKPVTNTDPCSGCTVTCMRPCTTYTYQMQRVPYTTYRPCYRTETYKVPVTTITNDCCDPCSTGSCATGTCATGTCATGSCATGACGPMVGSTGNFGPTPAAPTTYEYPGPAGTMSTDGSYGTQPAADLAPALNNVNPNSSSYAPVLDRLQNNAENLTTESRQVTFPQSTPSILGQPEKTAMTPVRKQFNYSPVRLASYTATAKRQPQQQSLQIKGTFQPIQRPAAPVKKQSGWVEVN